ncbi:hypothetical protein JVU88_19510, partial [Vibrio cholerae O1]|nr:hypothetical protein [Vibrio cholerae O1]
GSCGTAPTFDVVSVVGIDARADHKHLMSGITFLPDPLPGAGEPGSMGGQVDDRGLNVGTSSR